MKRGDNVTVRHGEVLQHSGIVSNPQHGMIYTDNLRTARATDTYIFGGRRSVEATTIAAFPSREKRRVDEPPALFEEIGYSS